MFGVAEGGTGVVPLAQRRRPQILFKVAEVFEPAGAGAGSVPEDAQQILRLRPVGRSARPAGGAAAGANTTSRIDQSAIDQALAF